MHAFMSSVLRGSGVECRDFDWLEMRGKVSQEWGFVGQVHALDVVAILPDFENDFDHVIDVALGVDAPWDGKADQVHLCGGGKHQGADFDAADSAFEIEFGG